MVEEEDLLVRPGDVPSAIIEEDVTLHLNIFQPRFTEDAWSAVKQLSKFSFFNLIYFQILLISFVYDSCNEEEKPKL